jgi:hypothetical protein
MATAVAIFSLAANIVQFIDFGTRLASTVYRLYRSGQDCDSQLSDIQKITNSLQDVLKNLQLQAPEKDDDIPQCDLNLLRLAEECHQMTVELLSSLSKVRLPDKVHKRDAVKAAFKMIWNEADIKSFEKRLDRFVYSLC